MTDHTTQAAVERLTKLADDTEVHYGSDKLGWMVGDVPTADLRAILADHTRQKVRLAEQRGVLEWIANHQNHGLTDGSAATRACLDEIVNLAAAALSATPPAAPSLPADVVALVKALTWFDQNRGLSLEFDWSDADTDGLDWCVYREHGGINDREWDLVANAPTPQAAILAAFSARSGQTKSVTMLVDQDWLSKHTETDPDSSVEAGPDVFADRVSPAVAEQTEGEG